MTNRLIRTAAVTALAVGALAGMTGCSGGGKGSDSTNNGQTDGRAPTISLPTSDSIRTNPSPLPSFGGSVVIRVVVIDSDGLRPDGVRVTLTETGSGTVLGGGSRAMTPLTILPNGYVATVGVPGNVTGTAPKTYAITVTATDTGGTTTSSPFPVGTITVPNQ